MFRSPSPIKNKNKNMKNEIYQNEKIESNNRFDFSENKNKIEKKILTEKFEIFCEDKKEKISTEKNANLNFNLKFNQDRNYNDDDNNNNNNENSNHNNNNYDNDNTENTENSEMNLSFDCDDNQLKYYKNDYKKTSTYTYSTNADVIQSRHDRNERNQNKIKRKGEKDWDKILIKSI